MVVSDTSPLNYLLLIGLDLILRDLYGEVADERGAGEREAIIPSTRFGTNGLLLMDERRGRREAARRGIATTGTSGIPDVAAEARLVDLPRAIEELRRTPFFATPSLFKRVLDRDAARFRS